jgi:hypothetical protein
MMRIISGGTTLTLIVLNISLELFSMKGFGTLQDLQPLFWILLGVSSLAWGIRERTHYKEGKRIEEKIEERISQGKRLLLEELRDKRTISENQYWEWRTEIEPKSIE